MHRDELKGISDSVLVVIGQIGAGKSAVCRRLASSLGARYFPVEDFRRLHTPEECPSAIAEQITSSASSSPVIFECSGASRDFEEIIERIRLHGLTSFVVLLDCSIGTAIRRIRERSGWSRPQAGGSWASQLRWTESRLRLVPADLTLSSENYSPSYLASAIRWAWETVCDVKNTRSHNRSHNIPSELSFSQLASFEVCPLSYQLKYVDRVPEIVESEQMFLGSRLHETLAWLYGAMGDGPVKDEVISWFKGRLAETLPDEVEGDTAERLYDAGRDILAFHYDVVFRNEKFRTIAVEKAVRMKLGEGMIFVGRIDRVALDPSGIIEVIDYKASNRELTSRPRIPDWLQIAAYSAAVLLEFNLGSVIARRIMLPTGEEERFMFAAQDVRQITLALRRWARRLAASEGFPACVGPHCASCQFNLVCEKGAQVPLSRGAIIRRSGLNYPRGPVVGDLWEHGGPTGTTA